MGIPELAFVTDNHPTPPDKRRIHVGINAIHAKTGGGVTYLKRLLPRLADDPRVAVTLFIHPDQYEALSPSCGGIDVSTENFHPGFVRSVVWEQTRLPGIARRAGVDVLFSPANFGPVFARNHVVLLRNATSVIKYVRRPGEGLYWILLSAVTLASLFFAKRVIAVSNYAARSLPYGLQGLFRRKISVVYHGISPLEQARRDHGDENPVLLAVSDIYVQKNYENLLRACAALRTTVPAFRLIIVGREIQSRYAAKLRTLATTLGLQDSVDFVGHKDRQELEDLYRSCDVFVFPSTVETFGQPLLEAMAAGAAVVCSNSAAMPEIAGEACLMCNPLDASDIADKIGRLIADERLQDTLGRAAVERAAEFSVERMAMETVTVLIEAAG